MDRLDPIKDDENWNGNIGISNEYVGEYDHTAKLTFTIFGRQFVFMALERRDG